MDRQPPKRCLRKNQGETSPNPPPPPVSAMSNSSLPPQYRESKLDPLLMRQYVTELHNIDHTMGRLAIESKRLNLEKQRHNRRKQQLEKLLTSKMSEHNKNSVEYKDIQASIEQKQYKKPRKKQDKIITCQESLRNRLGVSISHDMASQLVADIQSNVVDTSKVHLSRQQEGRTTTTTRAKLTGGGGGKGGR